MSEDEYEPEYERESVKVGDSITLEVLSVVPPPLEYMASLHSQQLEISGRQVWTGSLTLAHALLELPDEQKQELFENKRILELGSGTGLLGMLIWKVCSAWRPPAALVLTDGDDKTIDLLQANLRNTVNQMDAAVVQAVPLLWGKSDEGSVSADFLEWCQTSYTVWSGTEVLFDCIVAGDVLYKAELPRVFFETANSLLSKDRGSLWLCHVPRHGVTQVCVMEAAKDAGFAVETIDPPKGDIRGCPLVDVKRAVIYRMRPVR